MKTQKFNTGKGYGSLILATAIMAIFIINSITGCKKDEPTTTTVTKTDTIIKKDTVTIMGVKGCKDATALNYNATANTSDSTMCVYAKDLDDTTRNWKFDKSHSNVTWETDYKAYGYTILTGRFNNFWIGTQPDSTITFNAKDPSKIKISGWVQLSTTNTGEPGRDGALKCGPNYLGVKWDTVSPGVYSPRAATDTAFFKSTSVQMFWGKTGVTYKATGTLTFNQDSVGNDYSKPCDLYFTYNGVTYTTNTTTKKVTANSGFTGYFNMKAISDYKVTSTSISDLVVVKLNIRLTYAVN